jgi:hypothetical protein
MTEKDEIPEYYKGIRKAINHLHFELDVLMSKTRTGALSPTGPRK